MGTLFTLGLSHTYRAEVNISRAIFKANLVKFDLKSRRRLGQSQGKTDDKLHMQIIKEHS